VEEPAPGHGGHGGGHGGGEEEEGAEEGHPGVGAPHQEGGQKAQEELQGGHHEGELQGEEGALPELRAGEGLLVVGEARPGPPPAEEVFPVEGKPNGLEDGQDHEEKEEPVGGEEEGEGLEGGAPSAALGFAQGHGHAEATLGALRQERVIKKPPGPGPGVE
jgi:hypothetical protein